jgi:hypothetical protein
MVLQLENEGRVSVSRVLLMLLYKPYWTYAVAFELGSYGT